MTVEHQEIIILISIIIYLILLYYLLKEYDKEDHEFYIGDEQAGARVDTVVWDIGESDALFDEPEEEIEIDDQSTQLNRKTWFGRTSTNKDQTNSYNRNQ